MEEKANTKAETEKTEEEVKTNLMYKEISIKYNIINIQLLTHKKRKRRIQLFLKIR